jgi:GNAT superfamily N-acetyltransferase
VQGRRELTRFLKLPFRLHTGTLWVPPLLYERRHFLNKEKNPYFEHAEAEYFLAWRDGQPVGRITAQIDRRWDEFQGGNDGQFGFIEAEDDPEVFSALFATAEEWVRSRGRNRLIGPMDFTTNDECGLLIEGYERRPLILEPWHPPYYREHVESLGYGKTMDLLMWWLELGALKQGDRFHDAIHAVAEKVGSEHGITIRNMNKRDLEAEIGRFMEVYNSAWEKNWGFVPITEDEVRFQAQNLKQILDPNWTFVAERNGETLGAALTLPDINQVTKKMNGRLLPVGWLRFLLGKGKVDRVRVFALGVKPEYQHTGIAAKFYVEHVEAAKRTPQKAGDQGWILETNEPMNRAMEGMGGEIVKRYRLYEKVIRGRAAAEGEARPV